jgi:4-amino-4-deoxy-L-arabinose transferase-like glycosyltransferase
MRLVSGAMLFLALSAPWFVAVSLANPEFAQFFFVQEHLQRFTTHMHQRDEPWWFFIAVLAAGMAPWVVLLPPALAHAFARRPGGGFDAPFFLALWSALVFVFFSASGSKLPAYILPIFPALALLVGGWVAQARPRRLLAAQALLVLAAGIALALAAPALARRFPSHVLALASAYTPWLIAAGLSLAAAAAASLYCLRQDRIAAAVGLLAAGSFACTLIAIDGHRTLAAGYSVEAMVRALPAPIPPQARVYAVNTYDHTMPWTLRRTLTMVIYKDELEKAIAWEPQKFIASLPQFARAWNEPGEAYAFFDVRDFERLRAELGLPMRVLGRGARYVIVDKP